MHIFPDENFFYVNTIFAWLIVLKEYKYNLKFLNILVISISKVGAQNGGKKSC